MRLEFMSFQNGVLRRILGRKIKEVPEGWTKLRSGGGGHDFYFSPNIVRVINSRRVECVGQFAHKKEARNGKGKKEKLSLCLTKHHTMKTYWGMEV
jgi:hypothetical protein